MAISLYKPFNNLNFNRQTCFLSGQKLSSTEEEIHAFPLWLMDEYALQDKPFKLLDESMATYQDLKVPCAASVFETAIEPLEKEIRAAFLSGYDAVKALPEIRVFQWIARFMYSILYNEIRTGILQQRAQGEEFNLSQSLIHKFENLHMMLQSLTKDVEFEGALPWTIRVIRIAEGNDRFNFRDEVNTMTFSLSMKNFGIIACLQDCGANGIYHQDLLKDVGDKALHPIQYEEICARFFYSNYLFNRLPEFMIMPANEVIFIESLPIRGMSSKPLFDTWQNKTYAQVLENFWKPWGFLLFEILKDPESPLSFLFDESGVIRKAESLDLSRGQAN